MSYTVTDVDIVADAATKAEVERIATEHFNAIGVLVQSRCVQLYGPAGGNPVVDITFETEAEALRGMTAYCNGDESEARENYLYRGIK
jgi:hypothetical protein